jgi:HK97 family phage major capsid protein
VTDQGTVKYMSESTFTNAAAEVAEAAAKPESALGFTEVTEPVQKIATWIPVTSEVMDDATELIAYLNIRLPQMVRLREDLQLVSGDGTAPNISGILDRAGLQTQAKGVDAAPDAIYKAITLIRTGTFLEPDSIVIHPSDWQDIRLLRTQDGIYIFGSPQDSDTERIFGLRAVVSAVIAVNSALVGAFAEASRVVRRQNLQVTFSTEHASFFTENKVAVLCEERLALVVWRAGAFCNVTGI